MIEVEMKFPVTDFGALERALAESGSQKGGTLEEADHYFNAPDRDFAQTDEALRLRRIGPANFVTYKGPKLDPATKTRTEIEVPLGEGDVVADGFTQLLTHLGYRAVAVVRKKRRIYRLVGGEFDVEVCLDDVDEVGRFAELEVLAPEDLLDRARETVLAFARALGLTGTERRSYLEMLLAARAKC